ncbi:hypothetical protein BGX28_002042 [Mortierella sp. GBA30]|nr:hypothetical protein BGX28_002042 [Mortierella sp. GBA30]
MVAQQGIAQGTALRNVSAENDQDLMFMAGERVVLLERLEGGLCMGYCEGVVGRFRESDVDFSSTPPTTESAPAADTAAGPSVPPKNRSRASSSTSISDKHALSEDMDTSKILPKGPAAPEDSPSALSVLARHSLMAAISMDPDATTRPGPRKLLSDENLKDISGSGSLESGDPSQGQRPMLSASQALHHDDLKHSSAPVIPPRSSSRHSNKKSIRSAKHSSGVASLATKSSVGSMNSQAMDSTSDSNGSLAAHMTRSGEHTPPATAAAGLEGGTPGIGKDRLSPKPSLKQQQYKQSSASCSANNSAASSRAASPIDTGLVSAQEAMRNSSRPVTPILDGSGYSNSRQHLHQPVPLKSKDRYSRRQSLESPQSQRVLEMDREQRRHQEHDHYLTSVLEDIRSRTHHVLQKAGFSIAPTAGLYADRGSKEVDLMTVVQMPPTTTAMTETEPTTGVDTTTTAAVTSVTATDAKVSTAAASSESNNATSLNEASVNGVSFAITTASPIQNNNNKGFWGRPRSRSLFKEDSHVLNIRAAQSSSLSDTAVAHASSTPVSPKFGLEKLIMPWAKSVQGQRQRSNSGPIRFSDKCTGQDSVTINPLQETEKTQVVVVEAVAETATVNVTNTTNAATAAVVVEPSNQSVQGDQGEVKKPTSLRHRRISASTAITTASVESTQSCPAHPEPGMTVAAAIAEQRALANAAKHRSKNWFGIGRRSSAQYVEDMRKPHPLGHGIEGGIVNRHLSALIAEGEDEEDDENESEEDEEGELEGRKSGENSRLFVNDYGFIYDLDDEMNQGQDLTGTGSAVGIEGPMMSNASTMSEFERKKVVRKQKFNRENELKWVHAMTRLHADNVKKSSKFKKLVRRGLPASVRGRVWLFLAKADLYRKPGLFDELMTRGPLPIHEVIERDIHRCYPDHIHFRDGMGGTGQQDLHAVLKAYAHYKPSVGYCQGMGRLVGMMLMQMPVEDAFWLLVATIENYMEDYYTPTLRQLRIDAQVFERLLKEQDPVLADHLEKNDVIPLMYMTQWFMTLFTMSLPWASVLRVWDVFYYDGVKALFRVGLAILQLCREHLLNKCPSSSELLAYILHIPLEILGPKALLDTALNIKLRKQSVQRLIAVTAETMDAAAKAKQQSVSSPPSTSAGAGAGAGATTQTGANSSVAENGNNNQSNTDTHIASTSASTSSSSPSSPPTSPSSQQDPHVPSSPSTASVPPVSAPSSGSAPGQFSPLGVFKARKRAGTVHHHH